MPDCSLIIPVFNKWKLTRNCLLGLSATLARSAEIIVVDNASSDRTSQEGPSLGKELFGDSFQYIRNETNRNFAAASNQGANLAKGEYLVFLNNDTEPQPGWLEPLLEDFNTFPNLAATGPLLVYPEITPMGRLVQHLGVVLGHFLNPDHLYRGIPQTSPLARKRRFFQAITAACMIIPKQLFMDIGKFDEGFINGFEDVDLCARLVHKGLRMTVNPDSVVIHHESQTPGRHAYAKENSLRLQEGNLALLRPDLHLHLHNDGFSYKMNEWLMFEPGLDPKISDRLYASFSEAGPEHLIDIICIHPFWKKGWEMLLERTKGIQEKLDLYRIFLKLLGNPQNLVPACALALKLRDNKLFNILMGYITKYAESPPEMLSTAEIGKEWCSSMGLEQFVGEYEAWISNYSVFCTKTFPLFAMDLLNFIRKSNISLPQDILKTYETWQV